MKKKWVFLIALPLLLLTACSSLKAEPATGNHMEYVVNGSDKNKTVYWSTVADGLNEVKTDSKSKFQIHVPYQNRTFNLKVSDNEDMKNAKTFEVKKAKKLMNYDDFVDEYNETMYGVDPDQFGDYSADDVYIDGSNPKEGFNKAVKAGSTTMYLNYNDGGVLGIRVQTFFKDDADSKLFVAMLIVAAKTVGSNPTTINGAISKFVDQDGNKDTTMVSKGVHYGLSGVKGQLVSCEIYK